MGVECNKSPRKPRAWAGASAFGLAAVALLGLAACEPTPPPVEFTVTTGIDGTDASPGDGVCEVTVGSGDCSLRAAISEANANATPAAVVIRYGLSGSLTIGGVDDTNAGGDLDIDRAALVTVVATSPSAYVGGWSRENAFDVHRGALKLEGVEIAGADGPAVRVRGGASATINASVLRGGAIGLEVDAGGGALVTQSTFTQVEKAIQADAPVMVASSTIVHTSVAAVAGAGPVHITGSIIGSKDLGSLCTGTVVSHGWNVSDQVGCGFTEPSDRTGSPLQLIEPSGYPSPWAYEPLPTSPAFDLMPQGTGACSGTDQLGRNRPVGDRCEAGSIETMPAGTFIVDSSLDQPDAVIDGSCRTAAGNCTFRAAVMESNARVDHNHIILTVDVTTAPSGSGPVGSPYVFSLPVDLDGGGHSISGGGAGPVLTTRAVVDIRDVTLTGGVTTAGPGGGLSVQAPTTVTRSTISGNRAMMGGGIYVGDGASLVLTESTVDSNTATGGTIYNPEFGYVSVDAAGGALYADGSATVSRSTFTGNSARYGSAVSSSTLFTETMTHVVWLNSVTVVDNVGGPAVERTSNNFCYPAMQCNWISGGEIRVSGSTLANPQGSCVNVTNNGWNVGCTALASSANALGLGVLQDNGGPTMTHLPGAGSPVLDVIPVGTTGVCDAATATDQRGSARPVGFGCDAGAVERP